VEFSIVAQSDLSAWSAACARAEWVGIDTEFVRRRTYFPELGLIQLNAGGAVALIDPLAISDFSELQHALAACGWVLHSGNEDYDALARVGIAPPTRLFDTQLAAAFLGWGAQLSYQALCERALGLKIAKDQTQSDWLERPLHPAQLDYAALDVAHLLALRERLNDELVRCQRRDWFDEEQVLRTAALMAPLDGDEAFQRERHALRLKPIAQHRLKRLTEWRETRARALNLPRNWVLDGEPMLRWAEHPPRDINALRASLSPRNHAARRDGEALLELLRDDPPNPTALIRPLSAAETARYSALKQRAEARAAELALPVDLIGPRRLLERVARDPDRALGEWRRALLQ
jgi:ribonuclease D